MRHVRKIWISLLLLASAGLAAPAKAADQLVTFDVVYTAEFYDGTVKGENYHHLVKPAATEPASWTTPVDYSKGTVYIHLEVMTKPSARSTTITVCFDGDLEAYGCITSKPYTTTGVHETVAPISSTWQYGKINWSKRRTEYHLALKDGAADNFPNAASRDMYVPSMMRIVMTVVPPGGTYVPPASMGGMMTADAGATPGADSGAAPAADGPTASADAAAASPDATKVDPTPAPDAGAGTPKPTTKADAAATMDPEEDPPTGNPPAKKSGGCSVGGGSAGAALPLLLVGLLAAVQRRARRRRP